MKSFSIGSVVNHVGTILSDTYELQHSVLYALHSLANLMYIRRLEVKNCGHNDGLRG